MAHVPNPHQDALMSQHVIRRVVESDAAELARLTTQLGYPVSEAAIRSRLTRMIDAPDHCLLVAEAPGGGLAGWIHGFLSQQLESDYRVEIGGLVVDERRRRGGVGRRLVNAVHDWAVERGAVELSVRCREDRAESHKFYESLSFRHTKTQRVFRKRVGNAA
jgi:GNAT superfamily N-acetyltransferase